MKISVVLFDLGNVLSHDGHETYLTHEMYGLANSLGLPKAEVTQKVNHIFRKNAVLPEASETTFWQEIGEALGIELKPADIANVKQQITGTNQEAIPSFKLLKENSIKIGIISNSSPFFFDMQAEPLMLDKYAEPELFFLSHKLGHLKSDGLFELAAAKVHPATTFIVDDRPKNIDYAKQLGFQAAKYSMESGDSLLELTKSLMYIQ